MGVKKSMLMVLFYRILHTSGSQSFWLGAPENEVMSICDLTSQDMVVWK